MKTPAVVFQRVAAEEFHAARKWYSERSVQAADRFQAAVEVAVDRIKVDPQQHPKIVGEYRQVRIVRFPYVLIYRSVSDEKILIVAVAHTSRQPDYWQDR